MRRAGALEQAAVDAVQARDLRVLRADQRRPIERGVADRPAEPGRVFEVVGELRRVDEELLRDAADVHAGAAEIPLLGDRDPRAEEPPRGGSRARRRSRRRS